MKNKRLSALMLIAIGIFLIVYAEPITVRIGNSADGLVKYNVVIESVYDNGFSKPQYKVGSGIVISKDGIILTAKHVINEATSVRVTLYDGRMFTITKFYTDPNSDVAYIDLPCDVNDFIPLSDSNDVKDGDKVVFVGNPEGIWENRTAYGRVLNAALNRLCFDPTGPTLMIHAKIIPGYSGGGVYVAHKLVGIISRGGPEYAFVISSNTCQRVLNESGMGELDGK